MSVPHRPPSEWDDDEWAELQRDLDELERTDPVVRAAARSYDAMVERLTGRRLRDREQGDR